MFSHYLWIWKNLKKSQNRKSQKISKSKISKSKIWVWKFWKFFRPPKNVFFVDRNFFGVEKILEHSFDVKNRDLSIYEVSRAFLALLRGFWGRFLFSTCTVSDMSAAGTLCSDPVPRVPEELKKLCFIVPGMVRLETRTRGVWRGWDQIRAAGRHRGWICRGQTSTVDGPQHTYTTNNW